MEEEEIGNDGLFNAALKRAVSNSVNDLRREAVYAARQDAADVNQFGGTGTTFEEAATALLAAPVNFVTDNLREGIESFTKVANDVVRGAGATVRGAPSDSRRTATLGDVYNTADLLTQLTPAGAVMAARRGVMAARRLDYDNFDEVPRWQKRRLDEDFGDQVEKGKESVVRQYENYATEVADRINRLMPNRPQTSKEDVLEIVNRVKEINPIYSDLTAKNYAGVYNPRHVRYPGGEIKPATVRMDIGSRHGNPELTAVHEYTHAFDAGETTFYPNNYREYEADIPPISERIAEDNPLLFPSREGMLFRMRIAAEKSDRARSITYPSPEARLRELKEAAEYFSDPVEQQARINELRRMINPQSDLYKQVSKEDVLNVKNLDLYYNQPDLYTYLRFVSPERITELINKLPAVAGAAAVAGAQGRGEE